MTAPLSRTASIGRRRSPSNSDLGLEQLAASLALLRQQVTSCRNINLGDDVINTHPPSSTPISRKAVDCSDVSEDFPPCSRQWLRRRSSLGRPVVATTSDESNYQNDLSASGDSGYSSDSSDRETTNPDDRRQPRCQLHGQSNEPDGRRLKKSVTFADQIGLPLVDVRDIERRGSLRGASRDQVPLGVDLVARPKTSTAASVVTLGRLREQKSDFCDAPLAEATHGPSRSKCLGMIVDGRLVVSEPPVANSNSSVCVNADVERCTRYDLRRRSRRQVVLESVGLDVGRRRLVGSVLVSSRSAYSRSFTSSMLADCEDRKLTSLFVRSTTDDWKTYADIAGSYRSRLFDGVADSGVVSSSVDVYEFEIPVKFPSVIRRRQPAGRRAELHNSRRCSVVVEFAIAAVFGGSRGTAEIWDNNDDRNYRIECVATDD